MKQLKEKLNGLIANTKGDAKIIENILSTKTIYPFSVETKLLSYFLLLKEISYEEYIKIISEYTERNRYLYLYEMSPRTYGQVWAEQYICSCFPQIKRATKKNLEKEYPMFNGEFDLWYKGTQIEVKACRANYEKGQGNLASRAYLHSEAQATNFEYHFQQLKPSCTDIFIFIGTCRDELLFWVISSDELQNLKKMTSQHRIEKSSSTIYEGQIFLKEEELASFNLNLENILDAIEKKTRKNKKI